MAFTIGGAQVDDVELPAGRLGEEEERLVAQKRAAKEVWNALMHCACMRDTRVCMSCMWVRCIALFLLCLHDTCV